MDANLSSEERAVLEVLNRHHKDNKITDPAIRVWVQVSDYHIEKFGAGLRRVINTLRQKGYPICSDTKGYWMATDKREILDNAEALKGRAIKILEAVRGMQYAAKKMPLEQTSLL